MRYRLPDGCAGVILAGVKLDEAAKGVVTAAASAAEHLAPHGILPLDGARAVEPPRPPTTKKRRAP